MERILVKNTCIIVRDYTWGECEAIEKFFSIFDPNTHKVHHIGIEYDEENKLLYLPSAIDIFWLRRHLNEKYYDRENNLEYKTIDNILMKAKPRDEEQEQALRFLCGVGEYEQNRYSPQLSLCLSTGIGKTYTSIATIAFLKIKAIIITGSNTLLSQWKSEILKFTNMEDKDVLQISGSDKINMILQGKSQKYENASIYLCSHGTLRSFADTYGWDKLDELFRYLGIGLKFYDEAHTNFENMLKVDFHTNVYKTFYVTATPNRSDWKEDKIFTTSFKNVPMIDLFNEDKDPHVHYTALLYNSRPSPQDLSKCRDFKYGLNRMRYIEYITKKQEFYAMMRIVMQLIIECEGRALIYVGTNDGILRLYHWINTEYPEFIGQIGVFTSLLSKEQKMIEKGKKILLSTTKSAGLGEHIEGLKMTVVAAEPFKSEVIARQTLGRNRDYGTHYIELVDLGFKHIRKYYYAKLPVFNKYALTVSDSKIDNYELYRRVENILKERQWVYNYSLGFIDNRFSFNGLIPKKPEPTIEPAIEFINKDEIEVWNIYQ